MIKMRRSNLQSFCRTCLEHFQPKSASKFNINQTPNLTKLLIVCTSLNINEDADAVYPQNLCKKCYDTMQQFREFRDMAQQSDDVLRKIVVAEEEDKNIDTTNAIDEDGFFNDTSDSVNPEPEIKMEFEVEDMQENSIINKTVDAADDFANDSDSSAPTTSTAKKRKIHDETDKFLCKFYGCNAEFKTLQSLDDHIASQHATDSFPLHKMSRKREKNIYLSKRYIAKENVERGREHKTKKGNIIPAKNFEGQTTCRCKPYCSTKINLVRQKEIFAMYYEHSNKTQKTLLIRASVKMKQVTKIDKKREYKFNYFLTDNVGVEHKVCRSFLLGVYKITPSSLNRAVKSSKTNPSAVETRGKAPSANRTSEEAKNGVRRFINRFPTYDSNDVRSSKQNKFLNSNLNLAKMYRMYVNECERSKISAVSDWTFREIFKDDFDLSFKKLHTDT